MPRCKRPKFYRPGPSPWQSPPPEGLGGRALVFDACHVGVVLRAVLFVEIVLGVGAMYGADGPAAWLARLSLLTGGALPATLAWLVTACSLKTLLQRLPVALQSAAGVGLGTLAGLYACGMLVLVGVPMEAPWLASAASGALLSALLVAALVLRARARTPAATTARLGELQARIRPHFLFNTLNSAIALVRDEPARAEALLEDLSDLFRHALVEQGDSATLGEEIVLARRYLAIEEVRFGERLRVQWLLDPRTDGARLPPLLLQPLVENAVKHGVEPSAHGGQAARDDRAARQPRRGHHHQHRAARRGPRGERAHPAATASPWPTCATGCACCTMCSAISRRACTMASTGYASPLPAHP